MDFCYGLIQGLKWCYSNFVASVPVSVYSLHSAKFVIIGAGWYWLRGKESHERQASGMIYIRRIGTRQPRLIVGFTGWGFRLSGKEKVSCAPAFTSLFLRCGHVTTFLNILGAPMGLQGHWTLVSKENKWLTARKKKNLRFDSCKFLNYTHGYWRASRTTHKYNAGLLVLFIESIYLAKCRGINIDACVYHWSLQFSMCYGR